jgi:hypothetical protein
MPTATFFFPLFDTYVLPTELHALSMYSMVLIVAFEASQELRLAVTFVIGGFVLHDCRCMDSMVLIVAFEASQELRLAVAFIIGGFVLHDCRCMDRITTLVHWDSRVHSRLWVFWWALLYWKRPQSFLSNRPLADGVSQNKSKPLQSSYQSLLGQVNHVVSLFEVL